VKRKNSERIDAVKPKALPEWLLKVWAKWLRGEFFEAAPPSTRGFGLGLAQGAGAGARARDGGMANSQSRMAKGRDSEHHNTGHTARKLRPVF